MATERNPILHKTDWAEGSKPLPNLPYEINVEILLRLPVKSLLRFRCACKSWRSLISNPKFAKTHLSLAFSNTDYNHDRLLLSIRSGVHRPLDLKSCSISAIMYDQSHPAVSLDCPYDGPPDWFRIQGSCNGLVCISTSHNPNKTVILLNPYTRKSRRLPKVGMLFYEHTKYELACHSVFSLCRCPVYGFGYDESIDDYKVVVILKVQVNKVERQNRAAVYSLRTDSWRRIGDCSHPFELNGPGRFASGALHWIPSFGSKEIIVSLDLATETYGEVPQPECVHSYRNLIMDVFGGCLRVLCNCDGLGVELWVMKEYGVRKSWTKLFAIHDNIVITPPICIFKNGDITTEVCLVRYNSKDGEFCYPMINKCCPPSSVCSYIESLVSPDTNADTGV